MTKIETITNWIRENMSEGDKLSNRRLAQQLGLSSGAVGAALAKFLAAGAIKSAGREGHGELFELVSLEALDVPVRQVRQLVPCPARPQVDEEPAIPLRELPAPRLAELFLELATRFESGAIDLTTVPDEILIAEVNRRMQAHA